MCLGLGPFIPSPALLCSALLHTRVHSMMLALMLMLMLLVDSRLGTRTSKLKHPELPWTDRFDSFLSILQGLGRISK